MVKILSQEVMSVGQVLKAREKRASKRVNAEINLELILGSRLSRE